MMLFLVAIQDNDCTIAEVRSERERERERERGDRERERERERQVFA
jgi:hypothetical protein